MAPIKFEDQLKDKLEDRRLQPSPEAWKTLSDRLDGDAKKKHTALFWWIGIAASIVGVILVTTQFYKNESETHLLQEVVDTQSVPQSDIESTTPSVNMNEEVLNSKTEDAIKINTVNTVVSASETVKVVEQTTSSKKTKIPESKTNTDIIASAETSKNQVNDTIEVNTLSHEELKIIEVVDVIKALSTDGATVTDREIDSLLKEAQREILKQKIYDEATKTVDANALLQDVEVELDQSFRDKVFEALKSGYGSLKTAVAERRN